MPLVEARRRLSDAQLTLGVAVATDVALVVFLLLPAWTADFQPPAGLDVMWMLGAAAAVFLGPLAVGLTAYSNLIALGVHGRALETWARRLHLSSLALATVFFAGLTLASASGAIAWLTD